jgi:hypothetical protein
VIAVAIVAALLHLDIAAGIVVAAYLVIAVAIVAALLLLDIAAGIVED